MLQCLLCILCSKQTNNQLIFSSDTKTKQAQDFTLNPNVAGSIALETKEVAKIQGVQLLGAIQEFLFHNKCFN